MPSFLILGDSADLHAQHVLRALQLARHEAVLLDTRSFPTQATLTYDPATRQGAFTLPDGQVWPLEDFRSVYWRTFPGVVTPPLPNLEQDFIAHNDARSLMESLLEALPCRWVNGWDGYQLHQRKPAALGRVADLKIRIPATLCTNDPAALRTFCERHRRVIFKPIQGGAHARRLDSQHLAPSQLANLKIAPVTLQEEIQGTSVRVFVAGSRIHACEIRSEALDYRDDDLAELVPLPLSDDFAAQCRAIAARLHLVWTGMDFIREPSGEFVFLEANPSPMFLGFERDAGLPLTQSLVKLLTDFESE